MGLCDLLGDLEIDVDTEGERDISSVSPLRAEISP